MKLLLSTSQVHHLQGLVVVWENLPLDELLGEI
jgi:hypothetical protein